MYTYVMSYYYIMKISLLILISRIVSPCIHVAVVNVFILQSTVNDWSQLQEP